MWAMRRIDREEYSGLHRLIVYIDYIAKVSQHFHFTIGDIHLNMILI